jgi:hypothetical protein
MLEWQSNSGVLPDASRSRPPLSRRAPPASVSDFLVDTKMFIVDKKQNQLATACRANAEKQDCSGRGR